jgi:hypothetical protein
MREATESALKGFGDGYAGMESVKRGTEVLRADLGFERASPLERLLIDQAVLCYVRLGITENHFSRQVKGSYQMNVAIHWELRVTMAHRRYLKTITALARVRGLLARTALAQVKVEAKLHAAALQSRRVLNVAS